MNKPVRRRHERPQVLKLFYDMGVPFSAFFWTYTVLGMLCCLVKRTIWSTWMERMVVLMMTMMGLQGRLSFIDHYCLLLQIWIIWLSSLIFSKKSSPPLNNFITSICTCGFLWGFSLFAVAWGINSKELNEIRSAASGDNDTASEDRANGSQRPLEHRGCQMGFFFWLS